MKNIFLVKIEKGQLSFQSDANELRFKDWASKNEGKILRLSYEKPKRSNQQNAFLWLYLGVIERELGQNANDCHEYFKRTLLPPKFITVLGKEIKIPSSTTELSKSEMSDYLDKIASLTGVPIPSVEEAGYFIG